MKKTILSVMLSIIMAVAAHASDFDAYCYWVTPGEKKIVAWTPPEGGADGYEIYVWQLEGAKRFLSGRIVTTNQIEITWRTHGHYIIFCRAFCGEGTARTFSEWVNTLDPLVGQINGLPRAWVLYVTQY
jgi:hypothetical protein